MKKKTLAKLAGFGIAAACTATLVGFAANGTGAYFTDSASGGITATGGSVKVLVANQSIAFTNLLPGADRSQVVHFQNKGTGPEDIWLVFPAGQAKPFTDVAGTGGVDLGRYGHFQVNGTAGQFVSYNLSHVGDPATGHGGPSCPVDATTGLGGSTTQAANPDDHTVPFCSVPQEILLTAGLPANSSDAATLTFGMTAIWRDTTQEGSTILPAAGSGVTFDIVATQPGITPGNIDNSVGTPN